MKKKIRTIAGLGIVGAFILCAAVVIPGEQHAAAFLGGALLGGAITNLWMIEHYGGGL